MKYDAFNLNFIKPEELRSPSPVRRRVMMPLLAILACLGMCVWWGALFTQLLIERADVSSIKAEIAALTPRFNEVSGQQTQCNELSGELAQLEFYRAGVRHLGEPLAKLAEVIPIKLQLKELKITPPAPQNPGRVAQRCGQRLHSALIRKAASRNTVQPCRAKQ